MSSRHADERTRLLQNGNALDNRHSQHNTSDNNDDDIEVVEFRKNDKGNPRNWSMRWKYLQVFLVFIIGLMLPMASSIIAPGLQNIAEDYGTDQRVAVGAQAGFVCMLGIGPLFFAPMSETFGRRIVFMTNLIIFTLLQIPTALAPNMASFIALRTLGGFFGSTGVANGGGSISDMFETHERATVLGFYLLGPLLGPSLGPFLGGLLLSKLHWRWLIWFTLMVSGTITLTCYFLLHETCAPVVLNERKRQLEKKHKDRSFKVDGQDDTGIIQKIVGNSTRAAKILVTQPIVLVMSGYQALIFSTMYTLYTNYSKIWSKPPYEFTKFQVGLTYLAPATGFILTAFLVVPYIDTIYNKLSKKYHEGQPEYRLPLANIGAVFLPVSLFWFGWSIETGKTWEVALSAMLFFGGSQVSIFNTVQNYYIDAFESMAASALAAGAFLRSVIGGIVPLIVPKLFDSVGYGWGLSVFGIMAVILMPAPLLFFWYGRRLRERFPLNI